MFQPLASYTRRINSRICTHDGVWVYWHCNGRAETSQVRDLSLGGAFVETPTACPLGATAEVHFLVQEGQIRAQAVVRRVDKGRGIGLKFTAVKDEDRAHLVSLVRRARSLWRVA